MKSVVYKSFLACFLLICLTCTYCYGQDLSGIWRGYFITETGENYKLEFQVQQNKNKTVTGVSYSYLDTRFYGKATMTGKYALANGSFLIQETKTVEVKNIAGGGTCLMNYRFTYSKSGKEEFLEGTYLGRTEDRTHPENNGKWGDCGGGRVFLRRVENSDFYVEPFLRKKPEPTKIDPVTTEKKPAKKTTKPTGKPVAKAPQRAPVKTKSPGTAKKEPPAETKKKADTIVSQPSQPIVVDKAVEKPKITIPATTRSRDNELVNTLIVTNEDVVVRLYDNGEIDGDTISVYLDGKPVISNKGLSASPITLHLKMDEANPDHVLVMVAENLGRIPPNTSLMIVQDGEKRHQVSITSTEQKNAMVRFRYQKN